MSKYAVKNRLPLSTDYHFVYCTEEQVATCRKLCKTSPKRVVQFIHKDVKVDNAGNVKNNGLDQNTAASLVAVGELVKGERANPEHMKTWRKLIDAGVIEALVYSVLNSANFFQTLPGMPEDIKQKAMDDVRSFLMLDGLRHRLTIRTSRVIDASTILLPLGNPVKRVTLDKPPVADPPGQDLLVHHTDSLIWEEPFNTLREEESHMFERLVVAALFYRIIVADPTMLDIAYNDLTIPLITRHWVYSGSCVENQVDAFMTSTALFSLIRPEFEHLQKYIQENQKKLSATQLFSQMCVGAGTTPFGEKSDKTKALVDAFGTRFEILNGREAKTVMELTLGLLQSLASRGPDNNKFALALVSNDAFWRALFGLQKRIEKGEARDSGGDPTEKHLLMLPVVLVSSEFDCLKDGAMGEFLCTCARAGFFDAFDDVIEGILAVSVAKRINVSQLFAQVFMTMREALVQCTQEQRATLSAQFPRWRTLAALFLHDIKSQSKLSGPPDANSFLPAQVSWQLFALLHVGCKSTKSCARRGCNKAGTARCGTCKVVVYCGPECQKLDWKGHKLLCSRGFMNIVGHDMEQCETLDMDSMIRESGGRRNMFAAMSGKSSGKRPAAPGLHDLD
ncbi:hypothetical protein NM688_g5872 [Phlebia brevispora]|uniref:Uncharacterized protein n=1 Tax=Phlebia brevispora TaxID=194682 RepID=A0ACC1SNA5_9APHY|nr:hypothetical protein NM688_g5872 [Phlebia brevispora]